MSFNYQVFEQFPKLETRRLKLREILPDDSKAIFEMRASGRVGQFIPRPLMTDALAAEELVQGTRQAYKNQQAIGFAGVLKSSKEIIGTCGLTHIEPLNRHAEIGGEMATEYWGKRLAQEAFMAILHYGLNTANLLTIEAKVSPENRGAVYLLEQAGFEKEAHFKNRIFHKDRFSDMAVYTLHKGHEKLD